MITILGGGIGGLAAAIALRRVGHPVRVLEQASRFSRVGADINLTPNAVRALDGLGVGQAVRRTAARPRFRISRMWDTGAETSRLPMAEEAERAFRRVLELDPQNLVATRALADLARAKGVHATYVSRVLRLTLLAPELVEAILDGRQAAELQLDDLLRGFPPNWAGQPRH